MPSPKPEWPPFAKNLAVIPSRDKFKSEFLFEMLFQNFLSQEHVDLVIEKQHADLSEDLARIEQKRAMKGNNALGEGPKFVMGYGECVLRAAVNFLEAQCPRLKKSKSKAAE